MGTFLFQDVVFGPIYSRRLGHSLGINLLRGNRKICTFDCVYCECGWTDSNQTKFISTEEYRTILNQTLSDNIKSHTVIDSITFAGNGEPTLHHDFHNIINITNELKEKYYPDAQTTVLSNSTTLDNPDVFQALTKVNNIMKLDTGSQTTYQYLNRPNKPVSLEQIVENLVRFNGDLTIQTLLLRGIVDGVRIDNTSVEEICLLIEKLLLIKPHTLMLYPIARDTPAEHIEKLSEDEIRKVADRIKLKLPAIKINIYS